MQTNFSKAQKATIVAVIGIGLFNPATVAILEQYFEWFYTGVFVLCAVWVGGFTLYKALRPEITKIPKTSKNKVQYLET